MQRNEPFGVLRHRHFLRFEKPANSCTGSTQDYRVRWPPPPFPRRRVLCNRYPSQGLRPIVRQPVPMNPIQRPGLNANPNCYSRFNQQNQENFPAMVSNNPANRKLDILSPNLMAKDNYGEKIKSNNFVNDIQMSGELWIETIAGNGKVYYYNASTRVTRWDRPENVRVMPLQQLRALANCCQPMANQDISIQKKEIVPIPLSPRPCLRPIPMVSSMPPGLILFPPPTFCIPPPCFPPPSPISQNILNINPFPLSNNGSQEGFSPSVSTSTNYNENPITSSDKIDYSDEQSIGDTEHKSILTTQDAFGEKQSSTSLEISKNITSSEGISDSTDIYEALLIAEGKLVSMETDIIKSETLPTEDANTSEVLEQIPIEAENDLKIFESNEAITMQSADDEPVDKSRPISSTPIADSKWCVVWTGEHKVFFYDAEQKMSVWDMPDELKNRIDVQKLTETPPSIAEIKQISFALESNSKKMKLEEKSVVPSTTGDIKIVNESAEDAVREASKRRESLPYETRVGLFLQMLSDRKVSAFSTWEKELHKIVFDSRYLLLCSKERKQKFELYIRKKANEEKNDRLKYMNSMKDSYRSLLQEAGVNQKSKFVDFVKQHGNDSRFKAIVKFKDREVLFNDFIKSLHRKDSGNNTEKQTDSKNFLDLLREQTHLDKHSRWSEVKKRICDDERYRDITSSSKRERMFNDFVQNMEPNKSIAVKEKEDRAYASIQTRKEEVQRNLSFHLRELDKEREFRKQELVSNSFKALLVDLVRNPNVTWHEAKKIIKEDRRWNSVRDLGRRDREYIFEEHISSLSSKKTELFRKILKSMPEITLSSTWSDVQKIILANPSCRKFSSNERKCEKEFKEYIKDMLKIAKEEYKELLKETKIITYASRELMKNSNHLESVEKVLENDQRYLVLKFIEQERKEILMDYISELHSEGPPPPPTASLPSRREKM